ncbi:hypothetical protein [Kushneria indalinina]|uniref:Uncharacterized protein n=1 Tax=Kushneria indalinina DSM 14324 TaxID=1122140 RepID=A0A3D9E2K2_9GAMM|nr:hypothetical protein [Kushneria indalinina]REC96664.1 hypothetical protein C8D72_0009 [Kushneria indalinina DSM 14324]
MSLAVSDIAQIPAEPCAPVTTAIVVLGEHRLSVWDVVPVEGDALTALQRARECYLSRGSGMLDGEAVAIAAVTPTEMRRIEAEYSMAESKKSLRAISADDFDEKLMIMPPMNRNSFVLDDSFMLCEAMHGSWHTQFGRVSDKYASKLVNIRDSSTWLTRAEVLDVNQ